jgi:hypothetical protein
VAVLVAAGVILPVAHSRSCPGCIGYGTPSYVIPDDEHHGRVEAIRATP